VSLFDADRQPRDAADLTAPWRHACGNGSATAIRVTGGNTIAVSDRSVWVGLWRDAGDARQTLGRA
jgi:hypothetical protein